MPSRTESRPVRVLLVEDEPDDLARVNGVLDQAAASFAVRAVPEVRAAATELGARSYDLVLLGLARAEIGDGDGFEAIRRLGKTAPVIVLSRLDDEDIAVKAVQRGAQDYLVKDRLTVDLLVRSIRYARERHRLLAEQNRRLEHELKIAAFVQQSFLPGRVPDVPRA